MDLSVRDIRSHVRPYSFDRLLAEGASRLSPAYSRAYARSAAISAGGSHQIYASWFGSQLKAYPGRLYTLGGGNHEVFRGLESRAEPAGMGEDAPPAPSPAPICHVAPVRPRKGSAGGMDCGAGFAAAILGEALADPRTRGPLGEELSALLFPGRQDVGVADLRDEISGLAGPYCGADHG
jgi:hypothetical protein